MPATWRWRSLLLALTLALALVPLAARGRPAWGQTDGNPLPQAGDTWFFAEGTTLPGWFEYLVMINPDPNSPIHVSIDYQLEEPAGVAQPSQSQELDIPAGERRTVNVHDVVGRPFTGVAARLTGDAPFVAERVMYFINNFDIGIINGTHDALGVNGPSEEWYFAEGSTLQSPAPGVTTPTFGLPDQLRGFLPYFTMQNTSGADAEVDITYYTDNPESVVTRTITVPDQGRVTTDIPNAYNNPAYPGSLGAGYEGFGTKVTSDRPIIVERPFYTYRDFADLGLVNAATAERGTPTPGGTSQLFAEGTVLPTFQEFLTIFNPNDSESEIDVTYFVENSSTPVVKSLSLDPLARRTVQVFEESGAGLGRDLPNNSAPGSAGVSVKLESTNGVGFVAERPLYFIHDFFGGQINGAHTAGGSDAPDTSWFFAEGTSRDGFFEFITIQNPNEVETVARLDYLVDGVGPVLATRTIPPSSRVTVQAFDASSAGGLPLEEAADFGLRVTSVRPDASAVVNPEAPLVVERPIYVNTNTPAAAQGDPINGGNDTLGYRFATPPPLPGAPVLAVEKSDSSDPVESGEEFTYTITVSNAAGVTATAVTLTDQLPEGVEYVSSSEGSTATNTDTVTPTITFDVGDLPVGGTATGTIVVRAGDEAGEVSNTVTASSANGGFAEDTEVTVIEGPSFADLAITKTAPARVTNNETFDYTITVTNTGPGIAFDVSVSDTLPPRVTTDTIDPACSQADDGTVNCEVLGGLLPGETAVFVITVNTPGVCDDPTTDVFVNRARVTTSAFDENMSNDLAEVVTAYQDSGC